MYNEEIPRHIVAKVMERLDYKLKDSPEVSLLCAFQKPGDIKTLIVFSFLDGYIYRETLIEDIEMQDIQLRDPFLAELDSL